ncbi:TVP38/TMEM64 family protein [Sneathiella aquimaris]|jgi:uncharacterized membrane protein YdjX (TVP38/TMEM64 family)|uniref:TVP38/TMEM64 family protein n=1 Tax=Sneathiella aquimaris TaxID=2599305 RepID=UPI00146E7E6A|nr:TVP38/TMEM64 family protein [Sneathiella aquimaris]
MRARTSILLALLAVILIATVWWAVADNAYLNRLFQPKAMQDVIQNAGVWGPIAVIGIMAGAIVFSPLPSAPLALAAGAAYGHIWGTIYVLVGAEIGALVAFAIARFFGRDAVCRLIGDRLPETRFSTQNGLTLVVFVSRLLPFLSFDAVSYAAGLTRLTVFRFAASTFLGMIPASFLLAHFGTELRADDGVGIALGLSVFALVMAVPIVIVFVRRKYLIRNQVK